MNKVYLFLTDGFEETEALATVDVMRRAALPVVTVSLTGQQTVTGSHQIGVESDSLFEEVDFSDASMLVIPGGTTKFAEHEGLLSLVNRKYAEGIRLSAICAAPMVFGISGLLKGRKATCYPGFEKYLEGAEVTGTMVQEDGLFITAKGPAAALPFGYAIVEALCGKETADSVRRAMLYEA